MTCADMDFHQNSPFSISLTKSNKLISSFLFNESLLLEKLTIKPTKLNYKTEKADQQNERS